MSAVAEVGVSRMKREEGLLNLLCLVAAAGLFAFIAYNLFAAGSILTTDGLFFTVVPLVLALCLMAVPAQAFLLRRLEKRKLKSSGAELQIASRARTALPPSSVPALKDAKGRAMPPDVNRMVAQMNAPASKQE